MWRGYCRNNMPHTHLSPIDDIIEEAKSGRMFILVDDEDRENEGDLIIPAQFATPDAVNFMAKHGRGLICLALTRERVSQLGLNLMSKENNSRLQTAFTVSIEAREGVTTGISAADRAHTIQVAIDPHKTAQDIASPGHVFPLVAKDGGVLVRAGHTEAAVDIARLAGLNPSGVICEIMNDDGTMARLPDLVTFAKAHGLKIGAIADLISYRRRSEKLVRRVIESDFESDVGGKFHMIVYSSTTEYAEHIALVKGKIDAKSPVLVRMHSLNLLKDMLGDAQTPSAAAYCNRRWSKSPNTAAASSCSSASRSKPRCPTACGLSAASGRLRPWTCAITASARRSCSTSACAT